MRKFLTVVLALVFVLGLSGLALAGTSTVNQVGSSNQASIKQTDTGPGNTATIDQNGNDNKGTIDQLGKGSDANIKQVGNENAASTVQGASTYPESRHADIYQQGLRNDAAQNNYGEGHTRFEIDQIGDDNKAYQDNKLAGPSCTKFKIYQEGDRNIASQRAPIGKGFTVEQYGNDNLATQIALTGGGNFAFTIQDGDWNVADIYQDGSDNTTYQKQINGNWNYAHYTANGSDNDPYASTCCDDEKFTVEIDGVLYTITSPTFPTYGETQYQDGWHNIGYIGITGDENNTCQWQEGNYNWASIAIAGSSNCAKQVQVGDLNTGVITITGSDNLACMYQKGSGSDATIIQTGNSNSACVVQGTFY